MKKVICDYCGEEIIGQEYYIDITAREIGCANIIVADISPWHDLHEICKNTIVAQLKTAIEEVNINE